MHDKRKSTKKKIRHLTLLVSTQHRLLCILLASFLIATTLISRVSAQTLPLQLPSENANDPIKPLNLGESLETLGQVYKNDQNRYLQELWVLGRYHGQYHWTEGENEEDHGFETRRMRLGGQAKVLKSATLHAQMVSGTDVNPFYNGFTELWAQWSFSPEIALTVGQQKNRFTHDRNVSSRYLNYLERAMLTNMFGVDYTPAVTVQGKVANSSYYTGFFTNATGRNMGEAFTDFDSGYSFIGAVYHQLGSALGAKSATLYGSVLHSNSTTNATNMNRFDDGVSGALILTDGHASLISEVTGGFESNEGSAIGLNLQPTYFLNQYLQISTRYQLAHSTDTAGLQPQRRYERSVNIKPGDLYQAGYFGLNYYIAKHRLKLMSGIEYAHISGQGVWTASSMVRFYFGPHSGGAFPMNDILPHEPD